MPFEDARLALFAHHGFDAEPSRVADRRGRSTYLLSAGEGDRPTVLLHGGLSQAGEWAPLAGRLAGRVIVPDRPGCGLSYPIDYRGVDYRTAAADWLRDLLDAIDADRVDLVGNSMGGYFGIAFALAHPHRVRRLVLVGAPAGLDRRLPLFLRLWGNRIIGPLLAKAGVTTFADAEEFRARVVDQFLVANADEVPADFLELSVAAQGLPGVDVSSHTMLRAVTTLLGWRRELLLREELVRLGVPTLFLWGEADAFAPPASGEEVAARMPEARVERLPETGHLPHVERPERVARAIASFLEDSHREPRLEPRIAG